MMSTTVSTQEFDNESQQHKGGKHPTPPQQQSPEQPFIPVGRNWVRWEGHRDPISSMAVPPQHLRRRSSSSDFAKAGSHQQFQNHTRLCNEHWKRLQQSRKEQADSTVTDSLKLPFAQGTTLDIDESVQSAEVWARFLAIGILEVLLGIRHLPQLRRWLSAPVYDQMSRAIPTKPPQRRIRPTPLQSTIRTSQIRTGIVETTVSLFQTHLSRVFAFRLEFRNHTWVATAINIL